MLIFSTVEESETEGTMSGRQDGSLDVRRFPLAATELLRLEGTAAAAARNSVSPTLRRGDADIAIRCQNDGCCFALLGNTRLFLSYFAEAT